MRDGAPRLYSARSLGSPFPLQVRATFTCSTLSSVRAWRAFQAYRGRSMIHLRYYPLSVAARSAQWDPIPRAERDR